MNNELDERIEQLEAEKLIIEILQDNLKGMSLEDIFEKYAGKIKVVK